MYNEKTGKYDGISSVYRIKFVPLVVNPDKPMDVPKARSVAKAGF